MYFIQHCFICRPSDSTVSEDAGIEPRTVATSALGVRRSSHSATSHPLSATSHPLSATSHPHSATSYLHSATSRASLTASTRTLNLKTVRDWRCRVLFSSAEWFGTEFQELTFLLVPRNGIPSCFLFCRRVWKGIPGVCFYFCYTEWNSELFSFPLKGLGGNSESLLLFLVHGTEFRVVFSSTEGFGTEFRKFLFRGTAGIPSEITICSVYSVFRGIIFCRKFPVRHFLFFSIT